MFVSTPLMSVAHAPKVLLVFVFSCIISFNLSAQFTQDDVSFWVGEGENSAVLVVDFNQGDAEESLAWGFRFDGETTGGDMLAAIDAADVAMRVNAEAFLNDIFYITKSGVGGMPDYWGTWSSVNGTDWESNSGLGETVADGDWFGCTYTDFDPAVPPAEPIAATEFEAGPFAPAAEEEGSTAIPGTSVSFVAWATNCEVLRGPTDITDETSPLATTGDPQNATGAADGSSIVSLGDGGTATLTFDAPIYNGPGADFAVFENAFDDTFLELAFVEVSSDGETFVRFPAISLTQTETQIGGFDPLQTELLYNFAGKYRANFGTPFDLEQLADSANIDIDAVTHVRIVDVVGSIDENYASLDAHGFPVNDPFTTAFESGGFDLDAVGAIHSTVDVAEMAQRKVSVYPNPTTNFIQVEVEATASVEIYSQAGRLVMRQDDYRGGAIDLKSLTNGSYIVRVTTAGDSFSEVVLKR
ncbi:T9SS type A sorting domain-containing protein [Halocola ammonii]